MDIYPTRAFGAGFCQRNKLSDSNDKVANVYFIKYFCRLKCIQNNLYYRRGLFWHYWHEWTWPQIPNHHYFKTRVATALHKLWVNKTTYGTWRAKTANMIFWPRLKASVHLLIMFETVSRAGRMEMQNFSHYDQNFQSIQGSKPDWQKDNDLQQMFNMTIVFISLCFHRRLLCSIDYKDWKMYRASWKAFCPAKSFLQKLSLVF